MVSHAFVPTPLLMEGGRIRIFVAFLDSSSMGRIGWIDVDASEPTRPLAISSTPALDIGEPGFFDDSGVTPVQVLRQGSEIWLYYNGWQRSSRAPYHIFSGLAVSRDDGISFQRVSRVPILDRTDEGAIVRSTPFVLPPGPRFERWRMWLSVGSDALMRTTGKWAPSYALGYLESDDGVIWPRSDEVVIALEPGEFGLTRPVVEEHESGLSMLLSVRSEDKIYRIEEAFSRDGRHWQRQSAARPIDVSDEGWDSEMVAFPGIVDTPQGRLMFYNGNGYGRAGFGAARKLAS